VSTSGYNPKSKRSLFELFGELPGQISALVKAELDAFKADMSDKAKNVGINVALFAIAAVFAFFATGVLIAVAVIALALVLPLWLAALIVGLALLLVAALLVLIGVQRFKKAAQETQGMKESIRLDVDALKGVGEYEH
jgi:uncharacterized membrane protein